MRFSLRFSSPLARIYFRLFAFIFHWERDPKKTEVSSVWLNYLSSPKGNLWREPDFHLHCQVMKIGIAATDALKDDR